MRAKYNSSRRRLLFLTAILLIMPCLFIQFSWDIHAEEISEIKESEFTEEETTEADTDLFMNVRSSEINRIYSAGNISLEVISVMIGDSTWIEESGLENPGYTIDVYYHVRVNEETEEKSVTYDLSEGKLVVEDKEYVLSNIIRNKEGEISGRNKIAEPGSDWRVYCRSFCLMEKGLKEKISLPNLLADTPIELQMKLTDVTNETNNLVQVRLNKEY